MKTKLHKLDNTPEPPFVIIALSCAETFHKVAWVINKHLGISLTVWENLTLVRDGEQLEIPVFRFVSDNGPFSISLIANKLQSAVVVKELQNIDYLLEITGEMPGIELTGLMRRIRAIPEILAAIEVSPKAIKRTHPFVQE